MCWPVSGSCVSLGWVTAGEKAWKHLGNLFQGSSTAQGRRFASCAGGIASPEDPELDTAPQRCLKGLSREAGSLPDLLKMLFPMHPRILLALLVTRTLWCSWRAHCPAGLHGCSPAGQLQGLISLQYNLPAALVSCQGTKFYQHTWVKGHQSRHRVNKVGRGQRQDINVFNLLCSVHSPFLIVSGWNYPELNHLQWRQILNV